MSFDDEGGEPRTQRAPRPRRSTTASRSPAIDDQTLLVRRAVAGVGALVLIILIGIAVRSFLNSRRDAALRSYNDTVTSIANEASSQVSTPLFRLLANPGTTSAIDANTTVQSYRVQAQLEASRAKGLKVPGEMVGAQRDLLLALNFRAEALRKIADALPAALGTQSADQGAGMIAAEMEVLLSADVIYAERVAPLIGQALGDHHISQPVAASQFLPSLSWLSPQYVTARLTGNAGGTTATGAPKAGTHGHALLAVSVGGTTLSEGTTVNQIKVSPSLTFDLKVGNQGSNDETGVVVSLTISGTATPIPPATKTIDTKAGVVQDVLIPLTVTPPAGNVKLVASVAKVPGESTLSNNKKTFLASFVH
ncbi:MAG: hypothetical protein QOF77_1521 [Solirubrobacteraceae bacterium]|nr:hypothetical protein [Solirubrobacteraceae bacterium]